jgi:hypothetical protein
MYVRPLVIWTGDKYTILVVEDPDADPDETQELRSNPRIAFQIMPSSSVQPAPVPAWQNIAAGVLFLLTVGTSLQLGLVANVAKLPKVRAWPLIYSCVLALSNVMYASVIHRASSTLSLWPGHTTDILPCKLCHRRLWSG